MSNDIQPAHVKLDSPVGMRPRVVRAPGGRPAPMPKSENQALKIAIALLGLALVLTIMSFTIYKYEQHLATGETVLLELAPVDPRGFMQGDYMALSFALENDIRSAIGAQSNALYLDNTEGKVIVAKDAHGVAQFVRLASTADRQPLAANEIALHYRVRNGEVKFATNAFFFQEGHAQAYEASEYGLFRVNEQGEPLLTQMVDSDYKVIAPKNP